MYVRVYERLGQSSDEQREFEELRQRFVQAKGEHEKRLDPRPLGLLPLDVLKRAGVKTTTRVDGATASLLQSVLERSSLLRPYIADKLRRTLVPRHFIHHNFDAEFEANYLKLHHIVIPTGSAEEKALRDKFGFYHPPTESIHLRPGANLGHALHETIHKFASRAFRAIFGGFLDEGVTQCFTDLVLAEQGLAKGRAYENELRCANQLVRLFTLDRVAKAYFQGDQNLARDVVRTLQVPLGQLHHLRKGDALCKRLTALKR